MESTQYLSLIEVLLENLREAVVVLDGNLRVKRASTAFYRIFQLLPEDAENQFIYELNDGGCAVPELIDLLEKIVSTKEIVKDLRIEHDFPGVGRKTLLLNVCPILDKEEAVQMILITCEDRTAHDSIQQERHQLLKQMRKYTHQLQQAYDQPQLQQGNKEAKKEWLSRVQEELEETDKRQSIDLSKIDRALKAAIEEHKRSEQELRLYAAKLEWINRELQDFASVASHDLQEPLRKIRTFGGRLVDKYGETLDSTGQDYLNRMLNAAERMQALLDALLTYARVTTKAQPYVEFELAEVAAEVLSNLEARIEQAGAKISLGKLPTIQADRSQMVQLLQNLILNAIKFHRPGEHPVVKVYGHTLEPQEEESLYGIAGGPLCEIRVVDNGIGFNEKYLDRIFAPFQRLHGRTEYEGAGMGLAICQKIAERHGGKITAHSKPGAGSTFVVTLPAKQPEAETLG
jgi:signal transduction histidine kinase